MGRRKKPAQLLNAMGISMAHVQRVMADMGMHVAYGTVWRTCKTGIVSGLASQRVARVVDTILDNPYEWKEAT